jgi:hypothetical protein
LWMYYSKHRPKGFSHISIFHPVEMNAIFSTCSRLYNYYFCEANDRSHNSPPLMKFKVIVFTKYRHCSLLELRGFSPQANYTDRATAACRSGQSSWLQIQRTRVRFPALPDFLRSSGSGTGCTQPPEDN